MIRVRLGSSMMASAGYDSATRVLEIEFATGAIYHYADVPADVFDDLLNATSHGRVFHSRIRGVFGCHRVSQVSAQ